MVITEEQSIAGHAVIRALFTGPNGSLLLASRQSDGKEVAVKTFRPPSLMDGEAERADHYQRVAGFLVVARMQQELAKHAKRWARIDDLGPLPSTSELPEGAFYTMEQYPASLLWLIRGGVTVRAGALQSIVLEILEGLAELRASANRGHGKLTPANVLLTSRELRSAKVLLSDPAAEIGEDSADDTCDDRWALGLLIYRLVTHQEVRRKLLLPIPMDASWAELGQHADAWLQLCNRLLSMESADRPELDEVAAEVRSLHETDRWRMARRIALVGGVFVIGIAATILGVSEYQYRKACATEASHPAWVQKLVAMRNDPSFRAAIMSDDKLKANLPDLLDKVAAVVNSADRPLIPTPAAFAAARNGAHNLEALTQFLGREWGPAQDVRQLEQDATQLGWSQVAEDLKQLTQGMPYYDANGLPHDGTEQVEPKLVWLIQHGASTRGTFEATKRAWDTASNDVAGLSNPDAKVLESGLQKFIGATEGLNDLQLALLGVKDDCENLQEYVQSVNSSEKYEGLCSGVKKAFAGAIPPDVAASLKKLEGFVKLDTLTPAAIQIENARAAEANSLAQLDKAGEPNASEHAKLSKIVDALQVIQNKKWRQFESPDLNNAYAAIQQQQNDLESNLALDKQKLVVRDWVTTLDAESSDLQKAYPTLATAIGGLKTDAAIAQMAGNAGLFQNRQRFLSAEGWTGFLPRLDDQSQAACDLPGDFKDVKQMMGDWVAAVKAALPPVSVDAAPPSMDQLAQTVKASPWYKHLKQVDADFPEGRLPPLTVLAKWEPLYQRWLGINSKPVDRQFWNVQVASPGGELNSVPRLQLPVAQLSAMDATVNKPPADLVKTSMSSTMDLTALAAGRRLLDQSADAKTWPLAQVARWFKAISTADSFRLTKDDFAELEPLRRSQWIQAVNCAASEPEVKLTVDSAPDFQIDLANVEGLASSIQPKACYNLLVYLARNPPGGRAVVDSVAIGKAVAKLPAADAVMGKKALSSASPGDWFSQSMGDNKWYYFGSYSPPVQPPQTNNTTVVKTQTQDKPKPKRPNFDDPKSTVGNGG